MGWLFRCDTSFTIKDLVAELRQPSRYGERNKLLRSVVVGNHHWYLIEFVETGHHIIGLDLMKGPSKKHGEGAGYKDMSELEGPYHYDCPLSILDNARAPENAWAYEWRQKVRAHHAAKQAKKEGLKLGVTVKYASHVYTLMEKLGHKGWRVRSANGHIYRMNPRQVAEAKLIDQTEGAAT